MADDGLVEIVPQWGTFRTLAALDEYAARSLCPHSPELMALADASSPGRAYPPRSTIAATGPPPSGP